MQMQKPSSNGYGRIEQQIVFSIAMQKEDFPRNLGITLLDRHTSPLRSVYLWRRWSTRRGDDEDIVFELSTILGTSEAKIDWQVDWNASVY